MKLTPIQIEEALVSAAEAPVKIGNVEHVFRTALERLGENGEYWCKGHFREPMPERKVRHPVCEPIQAWFDPNEIPTIVAMKFKERVHPAGIAHCVVGAMMDAPDIDTHGREIIRLFATANNIGHVPTWNDDSATTWTHVQAAFNIAIEYARARGL